MVTVQRYVVLFFVLFLAFGSLAQNQDTTLNQVAIRLHNYEFERKKVIDITRSILLDYLKIERMDSMRMAVTYCDSITSPDSSWLSEAERYLIHFLTVDTAYLYNSEFYCKNLGLVDTSKPFEENGECRTLFGNTSRFRFNEYAEQSKDNLSQVLFKACKLHLQEYREKIPGLGDIWDFWEIVPLKPCVDEKALKKELAMFRKKYPASPLSRLKILSWSERNDLSSRRTVSDPAIRSTTGGGFFLGGAYTRIPEAQNSLFPNSLSFTLSADVISDDFFYEAALDFCTIKTKKAYANSDTFNRGELVDLYKFSFTIGRFLELTRRNYLVPLAGVVLFTNNMEKRNAVSFDFPFVIGCRLGFNWDHLLLVARESFIGPAVRFSPGIFLAPFSDIAPGFKNYQLYMNITVGFLGFTSASNIPE